MGARSGVSWARRTARKLRFRRVICEQLEQRWLLATSGSGLFVDSGQALGDHNSLAVALGDLDGDGDLDAFVANGYRNGDRVWFNATGQFHDSGQVLGSADSNDVALGDFDGDGDLDAFVAGDNGPNRIWLNEGGQFSDSGQQLGDHDSNSVVLGDFDGDGDLDAFVANDRQSNRVWWNDGGNFSDSGQLLGDHRSRSVATGDFDDDGDADIFVANYAEPNRVWFNTDGTFADSGQQLGDHNSWSIEIGDVDNDGDLDAFESSSLHSNRVWVNDSGVFSDSGQLLGLFNDSFAAALGDFDADGDLDAFVANGYANRVYKNTGGVFVDTGQELGSGSTFDVALGDVDADGDLDIFAANYYPTYANRVWLGVGETTLSLVPVDSAKPEGQGGATLFTFEVQRGGNTGGVTTVEYQVTGSGRTAADEADFGGVFPSGVLEFASREESQRFAVVVNGDDSVEHDEQFVVTLSHPHPEGVQIELPTAAATIVNDDGSPPLLVTGVTPEASGFGITFNREFRPQRLNLFDTQSAQLGPADVLLRGERTGVVRGSLLLAPNRREARFIKSGGVLEPDQYTVELRSAANGFVDDDGNILDGNADVEPGGDFVDTFLVEPNLADARQLSIPDMVRGAGQTVHLPAGSGGGIPLMLDDGEGVQSISVVFEIEKRILLPSGARLGEAVPPGAALQLRRMGSTRWNLLFFSQQPLPAGPLVVAHLDGTIASEAAAAIYTTPEAINLEATIGDGGDVFFPVVGDSSLHVAAYFGDLSGNGRINAGDASEIARVAALIDSGFESFALIDPVLMGDISGNGRLNAGDASRAGQFAARFSVSEIPPIPDGVWSAPAAAKGGTTVGRPPTIQDAVVTGSGVFEESGQALGFGIGFDGALGDLDRDGDLDAFVANFGLGNQVWLNDGRGVLQDSGQSLGFGGSAAVALGDLDGDADLDAYVANYGSPDRIWLNTGAGSFVDGGQNLGFFNSRSLALGDLDGDDDLDAFVVDATGANRVWINDGGRFSDSNQLLGDHASVDVALGDLDGDGDLDAFVANTQYQPDRVWLNNYGTFTFSGQLIGNHRSSSVALADLDDDGDLDAFVTTEGQANRVWQNDEGSFVDSRQNLGSNTSNAVALGDLDADGDLDAFVANSGDEGSSVWLNDNNGKFTDSGQQIGSGSFVDVSLGDLDGDGDLDAFAVNTAGPDTVWLNRNLTPEVTLSLDPPAVAEGGGVAVFAVNLSEPFGFDISVTLRLTGTALPGIDFMATPREFVIPAGQTSGIMRVTAIQDALIEGNETLAVDIVALSNGGEVGEQLQTLTIIDDETQPTVSMSIDQETIPEAGGVAIATLSLSAPSELQVEVELTATGTATRQADYLLSASRVVFPPQATTATLTITALDDLLDEDLETVDLSIASVVNGVPDISSSRTIFLEDDDLSRAQIVQTLPASNSFNASPATDLRVTLDGPVDQSAAGLDTLAVHSAQKGKLTLADVSLSGPTVAVTPGEPFFPGELVQVTATSELRDQNQRQLHPRVWQFRTATSGDGNGQFEESGQNLGQMAAKDVALGDLDADGDLDAVETSEYLISVQRNDGSGVFSPTGQVIPGNSFEIELGDVDNDGDLDIVGTRHVLLNDGQGSFVDSRQELGGNGRSLALGDLDADGDLDIVKGTLYAGDRVWINDGQGKFADSGQQLGDATSQGIALGDVDGDGDLDAWSANYGPANRVWINNSKGGFTDSGQQLGGFSASWDVELGDFDGDGDVDALVANDPNGGAPSRIWFNNGHGQFTDSGQRLGAGERNWSVAVGDLDADGDLDAVAADVNEESRVWINEGFGIFADNGQSLQPATRETVHVALGDLDSDGDLDVWEANDQHASRVFWNTDLDPVVTLRVSHDEISEGRAARVIAELSKRFGRAVTVDFELTGSATSQPTPPRLSVFGPTTRHSDPEVMNETLGITGYTIESFEDETLIPGLEITLAGLLDVPRTGPTNTIPESARRVHDKLTPPAWSGDWWVSSALGMDSRARTVFDLPENTVSFGIAARANFHRVRIDGEIVVDSIGDIPREAGSDLYLRFDAVPGEAIHSVEFEFRHDLHDFSSAIFDHLAILQSSEPLQRPDYVASRRHRVVFPAGVPAGTAAPITIATLADGLDEPTETVTARITNLINGKLGEVDEVTVRILDGDPPPSVSLSLDTPAIDEGIGAATLTATLSEPSGFDVIVDLEFAGTAEMVLDYLVANSFLIIPAGSTSATRTIAAKADQRDEFTETIVVSISSATHATVGTNQTVTLAVQDERPGPLALTGFSPDSSGFTVSFGAELNASVLNVFDGLADGWGPADLLLEGDTQGRVAGSLVAEHGGQSYRFIKTGGSLAPDNYRAILRYAPSGFWPQETLGEGGGDESRLVTIPFTVPAAEETPLVFIPDFARGAGQPVNLPADSERGIPLVISEGSRVTEVELTVTYDPVLLEVLSATVPPEAPLGAFVEMAIDEPGMASIRYFTPRSLPAGTQQFASLQARVPLGAQGDGARQQVLRVDDLVVRVVGGVEVPAMSESALHVVSYLGDLSGNGIINAGDAARLARVAALIDGGFANSPLTDPRWLGDVSGSGRLNAGDAALVARFAALLDVPQIPPLPHLNGLDTVFADWPGRDELTALSL